MWDENSLRKIYYNITTQILFLHTILKVKFLLSSAKKEPRYHALYKRRDKEIRGMEVFFHENVTDELKIRYLFDVADKLNLGDGKVTEDDPASDEEDEDDDE